MIGDGCYGAVTLGLLTADFAVGKKVWGSGEVVENEKAVRDTHGGEGETDLLVSTSYGGMTRLQVRRVYPACVGKSRLPAGSSPVVCVECEWCGGMCQAGNGLPPPFVVPSFRRSWERWCSPQALIAQPGVLEALLQPRQGGSFCSLWGGAIVALTGGETAACPESPHTALNGRGRPFSLRAHPWSTRTCCPPRPAIRVTPSASRFLSHSLPGHRSSFVPISRFSWFLFPGAPPLPSRLFAAFAPLR